MRTREPPAIFQPSAMTTYNPLKALQQKFVNMAYKHPQLLISDRDECDKVDSDPDENVMKPVPDYNDQNKCQPTFKLEIFHENDYTDGEIVKKPNDNGCRLIGNVKPNLIKTWEQLNGSMTSHSVTMARQKRPTQENNEKFDTQPEYNPMVYFSNNNNNHILFDQSKSTASKNNESFVIKRPASQSGHFYDSIDNESVVTQDDDDQLIASLCDDIEHGGETMAEYISLIEKKEKLCWSIDSCN